MTVEDALIAALAYEEKVASHYEHAAKSVDSALARKVFGKLAAEERYHVDYLRARLQVWQRDGKISFEKLRSAVPDAEWLTAGWKKLRKSPLNQDTFNELALLKDALVLEEEVSAHYQRFVDQMEDDVRKMFLMFVKIECAHTSYVKKQVEALEKTGNLISPD